MQSVDASVAPPVHGEAFGDAVAAGPALAAAEWRRGWPLPIAALLGIFTAVLYVYSTGLFIAPLAAAFGWSRTVVTGGILVVGVFAALCNPFVGLALDRIGPGRIALGGTLAYAASFALLSRAGPGQAGWWAAWVCIALASVAISVPVWLIAVVHRFDRSRGKALAIGYSGSSLAAIFVPFLTKALIDGFGWRGAYVGLGLLAAVTGGIAAAILLAMDRHGPAAGGAKHAAREPAGPHLRAALAGPVFWRIALMSILVTLGVIGLTVHFVAICADHGIDRTAAAGLAGLIGISGIVGRLGTGALLDRFPGPTIGAIVYLVPALACLMLWLGEPGLAGMTVVALSIGAALGAELDIMAFLAGRYFRLADYGLLFGILTGIVGCAAGFGPLFASLLRDISGSYGNLAMLLMGGFLLSSLLVGTLGPYPQGATDRPDGEGWGPR